MKTFNVIDKCSFSVPLVAILSVFVGLVVLPAPSWAGFGRLNVAPLGQLQGGQLLPPSAMPRGLSLTDMAAANAQFVTSGNNPQFLPSTPFQFLYADPNSISFSPDGTGLLETGTNKFSVQAGTTYYVPIASVDDSPPVPGGAQAFPTNRSAAISYFFDSDKVGGSALIKIDGRTTSIGPSYLVGPITTKPLQDGGGTHIITIGVFLTPLSKGSHTVSITTRLDGAFIPGAIGFDFLQGEFTYIVTVE